MEALSLREDIGDKTAVAGQNTLQLIAFSIGDQTYGVEITTVREIRAWNGATPLPNTRDFVRGVINLRGTIVPIFDLRARFGDGQTSPTKNHVVVVMSVGDKWVGILVDAVSDILTVSREDIHNVPEGNAIDTELLNGIITHDSLESISLLFARNNDYRSVRVLCQHLGMVERSRIWHGV